METVQENCIWDVSIAIYVVLDVLYGKQRSSFQYNSVCLSMCVSVLCFSVLIEKLYVFVSGSYVHARWLEIKQVMYANERPRELQRLSDTHCMQSSSRQVDCRY